jgi:hypothetical protein
MPSPQLNLRVPLEHHDLLRTVAARLRTDAAFADKLAALLAGVADPVASPVADASALASIIARLEVLEALGDRVEALESRTRQEGAGTVTGAAEKPADTPVLVEASQKRRKWTEADFAVLQAVAARGGTQADACRELGRTSSDVNKYWKSMDLPVPPRKGRKLVRRQPP